MQGKILEKIKKCLSNALGIKDHYTYPHVSDIVTRGDSMFSMHTVETYVEEEPTTIEWLQDLVPTSRQLGQYLYNLFPFINWIGRYNPQWLIGDLVAGQFTPSPSHSFAQHTRC
jgi:solute carrier family 26 (sodium-independent sulfate anion transporter), member 11